MKQTIATGNLYGNFPARDPKTPTRQKAMPLMDITAAEITKWIVDAARVVGAVFAQIAF